MPARPAATLAELAGRRMARLRATGAAPPIGVLRCNEAHAVPDLATYVNRLSPRYAPPLHLKPLVDVFEAWRVSRKPIRALLSVPPRHGKTLTLLHAIPWVLEQAPHLTNAYVTYSQDLADSKSRVAQNLALRAGLHLSSRSLAEWRTTEGGGLLATSIGGPLTGQGVDGIAIVDDPTKNRADAESTKKRETNKEWMRDVMETRIEPGASCIVVATRWHPDDLIGWLASGEVGEWQTINMPALSEDGTDTPLWPERWTAPALREKRKRVGEYTWASLFQGHPRPRGGTVFGDPTTYSAQHTAGRFAIGLDLAYSAKKSSDWSCAVVMRELARVVQVVHVERVQYRAPQFVELLKRLRDRYPTARMRWYAAGTELAAGQFMLDAKLPVELFPATTDKFVRAINYAAAWNAQEVQVPEDAPWLDSFLVEHAEFTGVQDAHDDQVDASVAAYDLLTGGRAEYRGLAERGIHTHRRV